MSLVEEFADTFDVFDNASSACVVEEATDPTYLAIVGFAYTFALFAVLIMPTVIERLSW